MSKPKTYKQLRSQASNFTKKPGVRSSVFARDGYKCVECGSVENLTVDHIVSIYRGGAPRDFGNLQTLCSICNSRKAP